MHLRRRTSSTPSRADGRGVQIIGTAGAVNHDPRPFHCIGRTRHRWGVAFLSRWDRQTGRFVRVDYCKRPRCVAIRKVAVRGASS